MRSGAAPSREGSLASVLNGFVLDTVYLHDAPSWPKVFDAYKAAGHPDVENAEALPADELFTLIYDTSTRRARHCDAPLRLWRRPTSARSHTRVHSQLGHA